MKVHYMSESNEWYTPFDLYETLDKEFNFNLDPCATDDNAKCDKYYTINDDGLSKDWDGNVFVNPPYGREIKDWVEKSFVESQREGERERERESSGYVNTKSYRHTILA
jgi:phage N-6-adenine-methyltransferase